MYSGEMVLKKRKESKLQYQMERKDSQGILDLLEMNGKMSLDEEKG